MRSIFSAKFILLLIAVLLVSTAAAQYLSGSKKLVSPSSNTASVDAGVVHRSSYDQHIDAALQYSLDGKYHDSVKILLPLARKDIPRAKLYLGVAYYHGHGVAKDRAKAKEIFSNLHEINYEKGIVSTYLTLMARAAPNL